MLTIYNFSLHKSPQQGYDRQKKKCKTTISPLLTFNLKVGFTFSVLSKCRAPTMWNRLRNLMRLFTKKSCYHQGFFRRETASGFYPWGKVDSPRKRVADGLCGWRHGNSFPMTQSAQSLRQMRSIPHCSKAVFYVFVFDSIHNSATLHNLSPGIFHWTKTSPCMVWIKKVARAVAPTTFWCPRWDSNSHEPLFTTPSK